MLVLFVKQGRGIGRISTACTSESIFHERPESRHHQFDSAV
jgi:hypothetical protein